MPLDLCTPGNRDILERNICLSALSKNLKGELKPLHRALERCAKLKCRTLKTIHFLELHVATNVPCDSAPGKLLDGPGINTWPATAGGVIVFASTRNAQRLQRDPTQQVFVLPGR